jgi:hypothetical protein
MGQTTIGELAEALDNTQGQIPEDVVMAFCPAGAFVGGLPLIPLTAGHDLFLSQTKHPLSRSAGTSWTAVDVAMALFAFTRPSRTLFGLIANDELEDALHEFLDSIPMGDIETAAADLIAHWLRARATALPMQHPSGVDSRSKKKADSDGGSQSYPGRAKTTDGSRRR